MAFYGKESCPTGIFCAIWGRTIMTTHLTGLRPLRLLSMGVYLKGKLFKKSRTRFLNSKLPSSRRLKPFVQNLRSRLWIVLFFARNYWFSEISHGTRNSTINKFPKCVEHSVEVSQNYVQYQRTYTYYGVFAPCGNCWNAETSKDARNNSWASVCCSLLGNARCCHRRDRCYAMIVTHVSTTEAEFSVWSVRRLYK
jgi:hypothetical protein